MSDLVVPTSKQPWRTAITLAVFASLFGVVTWRLHELQINQSTDLSAMAERQRTRTAAIAAPRGSILDQRGVPLAVSAAGWDVYADPGYMNDKLRATVELARLTGVSRAELRKQFEARNNGRLLVKDLDETTANEIMDLDLSGIHLRRSYRRRYPSGPLAPHTLGFVLTDGSGGAGIEASFNEYLQGSAGSETHMVDALGKPLLTLDNHYTPAQNGANVVLTIDAVIQRELEIALLEAVERHQPETASAIVVRPYTGEIVAMASWPDFDPALFQQADREAFRNNVLAFVYESGSTMKPLIAGAAVADGLASWNTKIFCENGRWTYRVGRAKRTISDHSYKYGGHQWMTISKGVAKSDNILMAKLAIKLGPERLYEWIRTFGFGGRTGIDLQGENVGLMLPRSQWNVIGSCMSVPMGHEMAVTPLQMVMAHAAVANGGEWLSPRIVKRVYTVDSETGVQTDQRLPSRQTRRRILKSQDALAIQEAMALVMTEGTGKRVQLDGYSSAGKTGTTEKLIDVGGKKVYSKSNHIGSFVGWAPANPSLRPELVALVTIDDPKKNGHYGSQTAAPVVRRILQFGLEQQAIAYDKERESDQ